MGGCNALVDDGIKTEESSPGVAGHAPESLSGAGEKRRGNGNGGGRLHGGYLRWKYSDVVLLSIVVVVDIDRRSTNDGLGKVDEVKVNDESDCILSSAAGTSDLLPRWPNRYAQKKEWGMYSECGCWLQRSDGQPKAKRVKSRKGEQKKEGEREGKRTDLTGLWVFSRKWRNAQIRDVKP
jgi:hypothetical protein